MAVTHVQLSYLTSEGDRVAEDEAIVLLLGELDHAKDIRVAPADAGPAPDDARADVASVQAILVSIPAAIASIQSLMTLLKSWKKRREVAGESGRLVLRIGGDVVELDRADEDTQRQLVTTWLAAHSQLDAGGR